VLVAVTAAGMMEVAGHKIIGVIAMWDRTVPTARAVFVRCIVVRTLMARRASGCISTRNAKLVFVDMTVVDVVQMTVV
jgi:hypothetical protein